MDTPWSICSRALVRVGAKPIAAFDGSSAEATVAQAEYEPAVRAALAGHRWRFATRQARMSLLLDAAPAGFTLQWQAPHDLLVLHSIVDLQGVPVEFDRHQDRILTWSSEEALHAVYTGRAAEDLWPAYFTDALTTELAALFAQGLAGDGDQATRHAKLAAEKWRIARAADSQQQTSRRIVPSRLVAVRR